MALELVAEFMKMRRNFPTGIALFLCLNHVARDIDEIKDAFNGGFERVQVQLILVGAGGSKLEPFLAKIIRFHGNEACGRIITGRWELGVFKELAPRIADVGDIADILVEDLAEEVGRVRWGESGGSFDAVDSDKSPRLGCFSCSLHVGGC